MSGGAIALSIALMHGTRITVRSTTIIDDRVITGHATALVDPIVNRAIAEPPPHDSEPSHIETWMSLSTIACAIIESDPHTVTWVMSAYWVYQLCRNRILRFYLCVTTTTRSSTANPTDCIENNTCIYFVHNMYKRCSTMGYMLCEVHMLPNLFVYTQIRFDPVYYYSNCKQSVVVCNLLFFGDLHMCMVCSVNTCDVMMCQSR